jgi:hypothetical protein
MSRRYCRTNTVFRWYGDLSDALGVNVACTDRTDLLILTKGKASGCACMRA